MDTICSRDIFKNPDKLPLNKLHLQYKQTVRTSKNEERLEDIVEMLSQSTQLERFNQYYKQEVVAKPALDKCWIEKKTYPKFIPYLLHLNESDNRNFLRNQTFLQRLQFLAECTYHQFWCYVACDPNVSSMIEDYLRNALPIAVVTHLSKSYFELYSQMHSCMLAILQRLIDFNLSEVEYLEEDIVCDIFFETGLFNAESIFTICYLYNRCNVNVIKSVVKFAKNDNFLRGTNVLLSKIRKELERFLCSTTKIGDKEVEETAFFLFEMASGLHNFLSACDDAIDVAFNMDLPYGLMYTYQKVYSEIDSVLEKSDAKDMKHVDLLKCWIAYGKFEFVNTIHDFTTSCINEIVSSRDNKEEQDDALEVYISLISNALDNELFIISYNETYPIRDQFQVLVDCVSNFDIQQTDYLLESLDSIINSVQKDTAVPGPPPATTKEDNKRNYVEECEQMCLTLSQFLERSQNKKVPSLPRSVSLVLEQYYDLVKHLGVRDSKESKDEDTIRNIQAVRDVLPHLTEDFVTQCLSRYNCDPSEVIARVLNGDLPTDLASLSHTTANGASSSNYPTEQRIGKKWNDLNKIDILDDKKEKEKIKELVLKASYTFDLDDEYDDRVPIGHSLNDSDNESRILRHLGEVEEDSEESESEEENRERKQNTSRDFCVDPAILREKRAQQYQSNRVFRPSKHGDQNSEKQVSKSTKPKHNRRKGATWKRNKGMIPS